MRKVTIWGVVLVCAVLLFSGVQAQRIITGGDDGEGSGVEPVPVTITNTPSIRVVAGEMEVKAVKGPVQVFGTVDVGNFPETQNVAGTVNVGNFPAAAAFEATLKLEMMGRAGDMTNAKQAYLDVEGLINRLKPALENLFPS